MKTPEQWKRLLESINFPNFNKSDNDEVMEFIFSNCKQRDALLTWMVIQLGADFDCRILKHEAIVEYLKKRRIAGNSELSKFVEASLPKFDQELIWDKLFSFIKMQKRLIPQPYEGIPRIEEPFLIDPLEYNEIFHDLSAQDYLEPLYKELQILKKLRKTKPSVVEKAQSIGDRIFEMKGDYTDVNTEIEKQEGTVPREKEKETTDDFKSIKKPEKNFGEGDLKPTKEPLPTEETTSGTWYCTPDGRQKVFVPLGAPPLGEFKFDPKTMRVVCEEDKSNAENKKKFAQRVVELEKSFKQLMKERNKNLNK